MASPAKRRMKKMGILNPKKKQDPQEKVEIKVPVEDPVEDPVEEEAREEPPVEEKEVVKAPTPRRRRRRSS